MDVVERELRRQDLLHRRALAARRLAGVQRERLALVLADRRLRQGRGPKTAVPTRTIVAP